MESIKELFRIGYGPSSSHTMAPRRAAELFLQEFPAAASYHVVLYGSLAATGKGHYTDRALQEALSGKLHIDWRPQETLPLHPNGMRFEAYNAEKQLTGAREFYSVGGGALRTAEAFYDRKRVYDLTTMSAIMQRVAASGETFWEYVQAVEGMAIWDYLEQVWSVMSAAIDRGIVEEGVLPGGLGLARKACAYYRKATLSGPQVKQNALLSAYALAVTEENASGKMIVTAPTCGSCGVLPAVLRYLKETITCKHVHILRALATAGLVGNLVKENASISGAEVGCQGEVGVACAMAAAAATQLLGGTNRQIEYAAEMGLEHHLGLTCDPVKGLVQIPCIERNAHAATRALSCADYALFSDGTHLIDFDQVVKVMQETGHNLPSLYRETSSGGLAQSYRKNQHKKPDKL
ncbi:MAG TPA: L-serine ammonia-lyase [bacterium]|nr:L-serine ammonia-lyase [bacterium]HPN45971.1 L-serine ammonia-lyase [bacterium]